MIMLRFTLYTLYSNKNKTHYTKMTGENIMSNQLKQESDQKDWEDYQLLEETKKLRNAKSTLYVSKKDKYEDYESSAVIFTFFGLIGDILVVLSFFNIINIPFFSGISSQIMMSVMFTAFFVIGIFSRIKAKKIKQEIGTEENSTEAINNWLQEECTKEILDALDDANIADEINILNKLNYMHELALNNYPNEDPDYLDMLIDKHYSNLYETE